MSATPPKPQLILASSSPRRKQMLEEAGYRVTVRPVPVDDGPLRPGNVTPAQWVAALAVYKGRAALDDISRAHEAQHHIILAADTVVARFPNKLATDSPPGELNVIGKPSSAEHATHILQTLSGNTHHVVSGVFLAVPNQAAHIFTDSSRVSVGPLADEQIDDYVRTNQWQGKAGGYNLSERIAAGWPIACEGDPTTVMGLPMNLLGPMLDAALE